MLREKHFSLLLLLVMLILFVMLFVVPRFYVHTENIFPVALEHLVK